MTQQRGQARALHAAQQGGQARALQVVALVLSVDEAERLRTCLPALSAADALVVIDNACVDATPDVATEYTARVVTLQRRLSYAAAMNAGLRDDAVRAADAVLLCNADCVLHAGAVAALRGALAADPSLAAVAPKLVRDADPGRIDAAGMLLDRRRKNNVAGHNAPAAAYTEPTEVFGPDGACALWRRSAIDDVAPDGEVFDEDLELWASDADLAWRARLRGWRALLQPDATGTHVRFFGPTTRGSVPAGHRRLQFRNRLLMIAKNDRPADLLRDAPHVLLYEIAALGYALLVERELLGAYREAAKKLPAMRRKRAAIQARRRARPPYGLLPTSRAARARRGSSAAGS
jgi:GT2 family glycosyltransferase